MYTFQVRLMLEEYETYMKVKELSSNKELRPLLSSFLDLYTSNAVEVTNMIETQTLSPDPFSAEKMQNSQMEVFKELGILNSYLEMSKQTLESSNQTLSECFDVSDYEKFRSKLEDTDSLEVEVTDSYDIEDNFRISDEIESLRSSLDAIYYILKREQPASQNLTELLNEIKYGVTELVNEQVMAKLNSIEENILNAINSKDFVENKGVLNRPPSMELADSTEKQDARLEIPESTSEQDSTTVKQASPIELDQVLESEGLQDALDALENLIG